MRHSNGGDLETHTQLLHRRHYMGFCIDNPREAVEIRFGKARVTGHRGRSPQERGYFDPATLPSRLSVALSLIRDDVRFARVLR